MFNKHTLHRSFNDREGRECDAQKFQFLIIGFLEERNFEWKLKKAVTEKKREFFTVSKFFLSISEVSEWLIFFKF